MRTRNLLPLFLLFNIAALHAQKYEPVNPQKDNMEYQGYTIKLMPAKGPGCGYAVFKGNRLVVYQSYNPFTMSPTGLSKKEDAYKVAQWQIRQLTERSAINRPALATTSSVAITQQRQKTAAFSMNRQMQRGMERYPSFNQPLPKSVAKELHIDLH